MDWIEAVNETAHFRFGVKDFCRRFDRLEGRFASILTDGVPTPGQASDVVREVERELSFAFTGSFAFWRLPHDPPEPAFCVSLRDVAPLPSPDPDSLRIPGEESAYWEFYRYTGHPETASLLFRLVRPDEFGVYSPPVAFIYRSPRGKSHRDEYFGFAVKMRTHARSIHGGSGPERVADLELAAFSLGLLERDRMRADFKKHSEARMTLIEFLKIAPPDKTEIVLDNGPATDDLDVATWWYNAGKPRLAAGIAGMELERIVKEGATRILGRPRVRSEEENRRDGDHRYLSARDYFDMIKCSSGKTRISAIPVRVFDDNWSIRNHAVHITPEWSRIESDPSRVKSMIDEIRRLRERVESASR